MIVPACGGRGNAERDAKGLARPRARRGGREGRQDGIKYGGKVEMGRQVMDRGRQGEGKWEGEKKWQKEGEFHGYDGMSGQT